MAAEIKSLSVSNLTLGAHCNFHKSINNLIIEATPAALHIETLAARYAQLVADEQQIVNRQSAYLSTAEMKEIDRKRDAMVGVINSIVHAHCTNVDEERATAAKTLSTLLTPYKGIGAHEYSKETAEIDGMVRLLKNATCAPLMETLGFKDEVEILEELNLRMQGGLEHKAQENVARTPQTTKDSDELRKMLDAVYNEIVRFVNAYALIQPTDEINAFVANVNGTIDVYKAILNQSTKHPGSDSSTDGTTPDEGTDNGSDEGTGDNTGGDETPTEPEEDRPIVQ